MRAPWRDTRCDDVAGEDIGSVTVLIQISRSRAAPPLNMDSLMNPGRIRHGGVQNIYEDLSVFFTSSSATTAHARRFLAPATSLGLKHLRAKFSARLAGAVGGCDGTSIRLWFDHAAYRRHPAPRWLRRVSALL